MKTISIVGCSNSGKTTVLIKLVKDLTRQGYRIGTVKHDAHTFEIDHPGKDSYRHFHAGSQMTMIISPEKIALVQRLPKPLKLKEAVNRYFRKDDVDLVITEGFKRQNQPKIEVVRQVVSQQPICTPADKVIAFITDVSISGFKGKPRFKLNEIKKIADFIERKFL
ncbi:MAG: molybdopterin-guanine dinucleotide biosynthesis protein B [Planctomycetota bacterium]